MRVSNIQVMTCIALMIILIMVVTVGYRDASVGTDTAGYIAVYDKISSVQFEPLFNSMAWLASFWYLSAGAFLSLISLLGFVILTILAIKLNVFFMGKLDGYRFYFLLISLLCLSPFFYAAQVNVIRHGVAILFLFLFYVLLLCRSNFWLVLFVFLCALGFHQTSIIYLPFAVFLFFSYSNVFKFTIFSALLYISGLIGKLLKLVSSALPLNIYEQVINYGAIADYKAGIRIDFASFTLIAGCLFYYLARYFLNSLDQAQFLKVLKIYWVLSLPFFFLGFGAYSDRYILASWIYLSVLGAVFVELCGKKSGFSILWYCVLFCGASCYFLLCIQLGLG